MQDTGAIYQQGLDMVRGALEDARKRLQDFDKDHQVSQKASQYLHAAMEKTQAALGELGHVTEQLKANPTEIPVKALTHALTSVAAAFNLLHVTALQYDETYKLSSRVSGAVTQPKEQAVAALATISAYAADASEKANAQLQGVSHGLRKMLTEAASAGLDKALPPVAKADEIFHVSERTAATKDLLKQTVAELDGKFAISNYISLAAGQAQSLDQKLTGGLITPTFLSAYNMGLSMVEAVQEKYEGVKKELAKPASSGGSA